MAGGGPEPGTLRFGAGYLAKYFFRPRQLSFVLSGTGVVTLPLFLQSEWRFSVAPEINAISTCVLVIPVLVIGLMQWLHNRVSQRR